MDTIKKLLLPISILTLAILFIVQYFQGDSPSYGETIKILLFSIPFLFVLGGSHSPLRRKFLILIPVLCIVLLQLPTISVVLRKWYLFVPWAGWFIYYMSRGYSDTMHLANEGQPKSVALNQADEKDTKPFRWYMSQPTMVTKQKSFIGYVFGYIEVGLTGVGYGTICSLLALVTGNPFWHSVLWGSVYGFSFSVLGFVFHKFLAKPIRMDQWGWWEMSAGIATMISLGLSL